MAKDPDDRYQSAGALAADARRALDGATITAGSTGPDAWATPGVPETDVASAARSAEQAAASHSSDTAPTQVVRVPSAGPEEPTHRLHVDRGGGPTSPSWPPSPRCSCSWPRWAPPS